MDGKRKSVFSLPLADRAKRSRVKAHRTREDRPKASPSTDALTEECVLEPRLDMISDLVKNIVDVVQSTEGSEGPGSAILKAAAELDGALDRAKHSAQNTLSDEDMPADHPDIRRKKKQQGLPALPQIPDKVLERAVFTHPGVNNNIEATYDRLEILGDAYIELIATKLIWDKFPDMPSGRISQIRELLVKNETLAEYATKYGLDRKAIVPQDYLNQPKRWTKTKGDIFEAYVAAVVLSYPTDGYLIAQQWLTQLWLPKLIGVEKHKSSLHAKEALAKKIMGKGVKLKYIDEYPPAENGKGMQTFFVGVYLTGWGWNNKHLGSGRGPNKATAGNEAAQQALINKQLIEEISTVRKANMTDQA